MRSDFDKWWEWFKKTYPNSLISIENARLAYEEHYFCKCKSCTYRKERGQMPVKQSLDCQLPANRGDLNYVPDNYGRN